MSTDVREAVLNCGHCRLANMMSHNEQKILKALSTDKPFDIISMDLWHPGKTEKNFENKYQEAILTSLCNMTGFTSMTFVSDINSDLVTRLAFSHFSSLMTAVNLKASSGKHARHSVFSTTWPAPKHTTRY
jgi:hypothetical protein